MRFFAFGGIPLIVWSFLSAPVDAQTWQTASFLRSIQEEAPVYSFEFWTRGLASVRELKFNNEKTAEFQPFWNSMNLGKSSDDGTGRIRDWDRLSAIDLGTLAHESYHAYFHNFILRERDWAKEKEWVQDRAVVLFYELDRSQAVTAMEEAYASFVGMMVTTTRSLERIYARADEANCVRTYETMKRIWEQSWTQEIQGYYYRDGIVDYWSDRVKWIGHRLSGDGEELRLGEPIFTESSLTEVDRRWISKNLFEERWTRNFEESFPDVTDELKACITQDAESTFASHLSYNDE